MAELILYRDPLKRNYKNLLKLFKKYEIHCAVVTKLLCGEKKFLKEVLDLKPGQVCDSRISNLKAIKSLNPKIQTHYIKPAARNQIKNVVRYADVSYHSEFDTIKRISQEAVRQKKKHGIIIMIEMGDLREGILGSHLVKFYEKIFSLKGIQVLGIGTNLHCLNGVLPTQDKLVQLSLYRQLIELKFKRSVKYISGGSSVCIPLLKQKGLPLGVNHFRVGETLFFGQDLFKESRMRGFHDNIFELRTSIIELTKKSGTPSGPTMLPPSGKKTKDATKKGKKGEKTYRALLDVGLLDVAPEYLIPVDKKVKLVGASSDMLVVDLGSEAGRYKVGSMIRFKLKYMGVLSLMNSSYVDKIVR